MPIASEDSPVQALWRLNVQLAGNHQVPLTLVEVAEAMRRKVGLLRQAVPDASEDQVVEHMALKDAAGKTGRIYDLLALAEAPNCLKEAIQERRIADEAVAFLLARSWSSLLEATDRNALSADASAAQSEFAALVERAIQKQTKAREALLADLKDMTSEWADSASHSV